MLRQTRESKPRVLELKAAKYTADYLRTGRWLWHQFEKRQVNHILHEPLYRQTDGHCSYCDGFPIETQSGITIDHFKPKAMGLHPELAFEWSNLFLCCTACQDEKSTIIDPGLLKPDSGDYNFDRYFRFNTTNGMIEPSPQADLVDRDKAITTIKALGLNERGLPEARRRELRRPASDVDIAELPYRFIWS